MIQESNFETEATRLTRMMRYPSVIPRCECSGINRAMDRSAVFVVAREHLPLSPSWAKPIEFP